MSEAKLATEIVRTPFGLLPTVSATSYYGDEWGLLKAKAFAEHLRLLASVCCDRAVLCVQTLFLDGHLDDDGRAAEWASVVSYDAE